MAKTNSERQAAFKTRYIKNPDSTLRRVDFLIEERAKTALGRMAKHYGITQWQTLERLILDREAAMAANVKNGGNLVNRSDAVTG